MPRTLKDVFDGFTSVVDIDRSILYMVLEYCTRVPWSNIDNDQIPVQIIGVQLYRYRDIDITRSISIRVY